jgi:hypothetical protein
MPIEDLPILELIAVIREHCSKPGIVCGIDNHYPARLSTHVEIRRALTLEETLDFYDWWRAEFIRRRNAVKPMSEGDKIRQWEKLKQISREAWNDLP